MPGTPADVADAEYAYTAWANQIRDQSVQRFANTGERDATLPNPVAGDICVTTDTGTVWVAGAGGTPAAWRYAAPRVVFQTEDRGSNWNSNPIGPSDAPAVIVGADLTVIPGNTYHVWGCFGIQNTQPSGPISAYCYWLANPHGTITSTDCYLYAPSLTACVQVETHWKAPAGAGAVHFEMGAKAEWWSTAIVLLRNGQNAPWLSRITDLGPLASGVNLARTVEGATNGR